MFDHRVFVILVLISIFTVPAFAQTPGQGILLPFEPGQTWHVCQGYKALVSNTHNETFAFDLTIDPGGVIENGCYGVNSDAQNASAGYTIVAPGDGVVTRWTIPANDKHEEARDLMCLDLDVGGSVLLGHFVPASRHEDGPVKAGEALGVVAPWSANFSKPPDGVVNGEYAHIHIDARADDKCTKSTAVPFVGVHKFYAVPDLVDLEGQSADKPPRNQYAATAFTQAIVSHPSDDASGHYADCTEALDYPEAYFGRCVGGGDIVAGFRFEDLDIPQGAYLSAAALAFVVDGPYTVVSSTRFAAQNSVAAAPFSVFSMPSQRQLVNVPQIGWTVSDAWELGEIRETPDLRIQLQPVVRNEQWNPAANAVALINRPVGEQVSHRRVLAFERSGLSNPEFFPARLIVTRLGNNPPRANAGKDQEYVFLNQTIYLYGSGSDPDPDTTLNFQWEQVSGPPVTIVNPNGRRASFRVIEHGYYRFRLTVTDNGRNRLQAVDYVDVYCAGCA